MTTRVVHCKRERFDVYIGRPSMFGNPFRVGRHHRRDEAIAQYEAWLRAQPVLMAKVKKLRGKVLGCWCKPLSCHGDVLARVADEG